MTSTTAWAAQGPTVEHRSGRRLRYLTSLAALVVAFVVATGAVLAGAGAFAGHDLGALPPGGGHDGSPLAGAEEEADEPGASSTTDETGDDTSDPAPVDEPEPLPQDDPTDHLDEPADEGGSVAEDGTAADEPGEADETSDTGDANDTGAANDAIDTGDARDANEPELTTAEVQDKLRAYGFLVGPADGTAGQQTTAAVMAFQRVNGLAVDGVVGPNTIEALAEGSAEPTLQGGPDDRIEVDLDRQLLHLVEGGQRTVTLQVSSGNGETYASGGGSAKAVTPVGEFRVERRIHGVRQAPLGTLYDPLYFHRGFAIHGSPSVPAHPASHGCVRVSKADAAWLIDRVPDGMPVHLYGGTHVFTP